MAALAPHPINAHARGPVIQRGCQNIETTSNILPDICNTFTVDSDLKDMIVISPTAAGVNQQPELVETTVKPADPVIFQDTATDSSSFRPLVTASYQSVQTLNSSSDEDFCSYIDSVIADIQAQGYAPLDRGIHHPKAILFYQHILGAGKFVSDLLEWGYYPHFISEPPKTLELRNNMSARKHMEFVRNKTSEWCQKGYVRKVDSKPRIVNPLTVASKTDSETGQVKLRQCVDLARSVNCHIKKETMSMEDVSCVLPRVTPDAWLSVLDVTAMYHHLYLAPAARSLFGFAVETVDKQLEYYICITLPFGTGRILKCLIIAMFV